MSQVNVHKNVFPYADYLGTQLEVTHYSSGQKEARGMILYFHGGGFVYGHREDLPDEYIQMFLSEGYEVLAFDYPLAPEISFEEILGQVKQGLDWYIDSGQTELNAQTIPYFIMGRSAGAHLALQLGHYAQTYDQKKQPKAIISFYGFFNLNLPAFQMPSRHYRSYPDVDERMLNRIVGEGCEVGKEHDDRFLIYLAGRQTGQWLEMLFNSKNQIKNYSLSKEAIKQLPPLFLTAATHDPDVPAQQSRMMNQLNDQAVLKLVRSSEHDFDRTDIEGDGRKVYDDLIQWLDALVDQ